MQISSILNIAWPFDVVVVVLVFYFRMQVRETAIYVDSYD